MTPTAHDDLAAADAGLRDVVETVWRPGSATGVRVSLRGGAEPVPAVETYFVLPHPSRARLLLPADSMLAARRALGAYRGLRTGSAEAWTRLIRASVLSSGPASRALRRLRVLAPPGANRLLPLIAAELGTNEPLRASLAVRRPGPFSKPTLGLYDAAGSPLAYAKIGRSPLTDAMVRREARVLADLAGRLPTITTPALAAVLTWHGHPVTVMAPLPSQARRLTTEPLQMAATLAEVAASGELGDHELGASSYAHRLQARLAEVAPAFPDVAQVLSSWCGDLCAVARPLRFGRSHGDWVTWNLGEQRGAVVVWDWELSVADAPVGFDACHWYFQRARLTGDVAAAAAAVDEMSPGLVGLGIARADTARVTDLYLLDRSVGEVEAAAATGVTADLRAFTELARRRLGR